ncbi:MAG TPA: GntR family transcriptional regulator [Anaerohalosphaeraceae bacterium]|nr:GntR family transcriptional regulator [Phycisphaerae bacterium]HOM77180.1 GntR family transcriptional regulator [Anaerohalosphaeraceae bacterium]HPC64610.1 GntR family transcriptional regulator [Anaerohalosphaeraceae bacterium]HRS71419.1 GntR family transcriptional regulator [Anaerohalosphaeraceae bacterium]HRV20672.1 GntR family transcriptional regulator [Anaerohalosphaeraceae bacterium]
MEQISETILRERAIPLRHVFDFIPLHSNPRKGALLSEDAYEHILAHIVFPQDNNSSGIQYGGKITESKIANVLQMSNGPVREAIYRLRQEGWIQTIGNRGSFFVDFSDPAIASQIYQFRLSFETGAFYTLAAKITDAQLNQLYSILTALEQAKQNSDMVEFRKSDILFHLQVVEFAGGEHYKQIFRSKLLQWYAMSYQLLVRAMGKENYSHTLEAPGTPTHRELYEALAGHNSALAAERISKHFTFIPHLLSSNQSTAAEK